jgi:hypothetical protein
MVVWFFASTGSMAEFGKSAFSVAYLAGFCVI